MSEETEFLSFRKFGKRNVPEVDAWPSRIRDLHDSHLGDFCPSENFKIVYCSETLESDGFIAFIVA